MTPEQVLSHKPRVLTQKQRESAHRSSPFVIPSEARDSLGRATRSLAPLGMTVSGQFY